eukprot:2469160-Prymnesium_polylepis.1
MPTSPTPPLPNRASAPASPPPPRTWPPNRARAPPSPLQYSGVLRFPPRAPAHFFLIPPPNVTV